VGGAATSIPIDVPPGRKNVTPRLALTYSSTGGPSPYGYGWDLPLGRIERGRKHGVLSCGNLERVNDFVLILPGGSVEFTWSVQSSRWQARVEESFLRIDYDAGGNFWTVWDKSGLRYRFGETVSSRTGRRVDILADTSPCASGRYEFPYTSSWALTSIEDPNGNRLEVEYLNDAQGVAYPDRILYGANVRGLGHLFEIDFIWSGQSDTALERPDSDRVVNGMGGSPARLTRLLARIVVRYPVGAEQPVRSYEFTYTDEADGNVPARIGRQSFLTFVTLYGSDGTALSRADRLPASTQFLYQENLPAELVEPGLDEEPRFGFRAIEQLAAKPAPELMARRELADLRTTSDDDPKQYTWRRVLDMNGDGFPDRVDAYFNVDCPAGGDSWNVYLGGAAGFSKTPVLWNVPDRAVMCALTREGGGQTEYDTFDLTGDGIPDFVDNRPDFGGYWEQLDGPEGPWTKVWHVYRGYVTRSGGGFEAEPIFWRAPLAAMRSISLDRLVFGWPERGPLTRQDLIDINGDGLLDLVATGSESIRDDGDQEDWRVWLNTGDGFDGLRDCASYSDLCLLDPRSFEAPLNLLRYSSCSSESCYQVADMRDMNGDGLPDLVVAWDRERNSDPQGNFKGYWQVFLNHGDRISAEAESWWVPDVSMLSIQQTEGGRKDTLRDLIDLNGDGLPDLVDTSRWATEGQTHWRVALNRGGGFSDALLPWTSTYPYIRRLGSAGIRQDTLDVDGDGLVDFAAFDASTEDMSLLHNAGGAWCPSYEPERVCGPDGAHAPYYYVSADPAGARSDLLVAVENGIGGSTTLEYRPSTQWDNTGGDGVPDLPFVIWTVTHIERDDGMCDDDGSACVNPGAGHKLGTDIRYRDGRFDPVERTFRGFFLVTSEQWPENHDPRRGTLTYFHQSAALAGHSQEVWTYDATDEGTVWSRPVARELNTWECVDALSGDDIECPASPAGEVWVRLRRKDHYAFSDFLIGVGRVRSSVNESWHRCAGRFYGNVAHGWTGAPDDGPRVHTHTDFACRNDASGYIVDKPTRVTVRDSQDARVLEEKWFFYDQPGDQTPERGFLDKGNVTQVESWLDRFDTAAPPPCTATPTEPGRCVRVGTQYDGVYGNATRVTDALGRVTETAYDQTTQIYPFVVLFPQISIGGETARLRAASGYDPACGKLLWETVTYRSGFPQYQSQSRRQYDAFCRLERSARAGEDLDNDPYRRFAYQLGNEQRPTVIASYRREPNHPGGSVTEEVLADALGRVIQRKTEAVVSGELKLVAAETIAYGSRGNASTRYAPFVFTGALDTYSEPPQGTGKTTLEYDAVSRPTRVTGPDGHFRTSDHSTAWETTTADECYTAAGCTGGKVTERRDALGRVIEKWIYAEPDSLQARTAYEFDEAGRLLSTVQGDPSRPGDRWNTNTAVVAEYDSLGRKVLERDPDSGTWTFGYDAAGNLIYQDDPVPDRHVQLSYDAMNRVSSRQYLTGDAYCDLGSGGACADSLTGEVRYTYDLATNGLGRLARVEDLSAVTTLAGYDVRGKLLVVEREIDDAVATTVYQYDTADHLTGIIYPDNEQVRYGYDAVGGVTRMWSAGGLPVYLSDLTYDIFGRPLVLTHGDGSYDTRTYGTEAVTGYRLQSLAVDAGGTRHLDYRYTDYSPTGLLTRLEDRTASFADPRMEETSDFTYDALGRLTQASGPGIGTRTYAYDAWGNMTAKAGRVLGYEELRPHRLATIDGSAVGVDHDDNGNRTQKPGQRYEYDEEDRLARIEVEATGQVVRFAYDFEGKLVRKDAAGVVTRYYNDLFEVSDGRMRKYYYAGGMLVASREAPAPAELAMVADETGVRLAGVSPSHLALVLRSGPGADFGLTLAGALACSGLLLAPWRRRRVAGIRVRHGHVILVALAVAFATTPWPNVVRPAWAGGGGGSLPPTPTPIPVDEVHHYHLDRLGSVHLVTDSAGRPLAHVRYAPYGSVRGRWDGAGGGGAELAEQDRYEFTGYETEALSGLQYAGARFYDPELGMFLTHDPARQFPNPYSYGGGDPVNGTDPTGAFFGWDLAVAAIIGGLFGAYTSGIQAVATGSSTGEAFKAAAIGAAGGAVTGAGLGVLGAAVGSLQSTTLSTAYNLALVGSGTYSAVESFQHDQSFSGAVGAVMVAFGVFGLYENLAPRSQGSTVQRADYLEGEILRVAEQEEVVEDDLPRLRVEDLQSGQPMRALNGGASPYLRMARQSHWAIVLERYNSVVQVGSSTKGGPYTADNSSPLVGGRRWAVYPPVPHPRRSLIAAYNIAADRGGYLGESGENICTSFVARVAEAGGAVAVPRIAGGVVTGSMLEYVYGPPIGYVDLPLLQKP